MDAINNKGLTLIEIVLIIVILGIIGSGILLYFAGIKGSASPVLTIQAIELAQEKMEKIISDKKANGFSYIDNTNYPQENPVSGFANFNRTVDVCYVSEGDLNDTSNCATATDWKRAKVTVSWGGGEVNLVTVLSDS